MTTSGATAAPQSDATPPTWLVMVYMQAGDTSQLDNLAIQDLFEMEAGVGENPHVQVLVQIQRRWPAVPQRYLLKSGDLPRVVPGPEPKDEDDDLLNMGTRVALEEFLITGLHEGRESGAEKYCLVLWGHAFGVGFGRDHGDAVQLHELQSALAEFKKARKGRLDILATNSCTMCYIEAAFQLKDDVRYLAASQVFVPLTGLPYKQILSCIRKEMEPVKLGEMIVDRYVDHFTNSPQGERVSMALLDLERADGFNRLLSGIAETITDVIGRPPNVDFQRLAQVQDVFFVNPAGDVRPVLDLHALATDLSNLSDDFVEPTEATPTRQASGFPLLRDQARELAKAIDGTGLIGNDGKPEAADRKPEGEESARLVVHHKSHQDLDALHGVGVFAPFVVDKDVRKRLEIDGGTERASDHRKKRESEDREGRRAYEALKIFAGNEGRGRTWPKLVYERLSREEPDEIVDATGVVRPAERQHVNQLLVAIEGAFNRLDRVLRVVEAPLAKAVAAKARDSAGCLELLASFGPPRLKLAGGLSLADPKKFKLSETAAADGSQTGASIVSTLARIEKSVQLVEKTCKRVVTNRTFGLGPPSSQAPTLLHLGSKAAGGVLGAPGDPKEAGEVLGDPKEAGEVLGDPKEAGEVLGPLGSEKGAVLALLSSDALAAGLAVGTLFSQVALALLRLEHAAAAIESAAAQFLFEPAYGSMLSAEEHKRTVRERFERMFGVMKEVSLQARRSIRRILAHPLYGLGPGPEGLGQEERNELAVAAGLNRRNLRLL
jgi:Clostripain family